MTESRSGILLSFELCTEQLWLEVGTLFKSCFRAYQSYKSASKNHKGKSKEGFYPQSGHSSTEAPHDDDDSPLKSVCTAANTKTSHLFTSLCPKWTHDQPIQRSISF